jgi:hypothetical protein
MLTGNLNFILKNIKTDNTWDENYSTTETCDINGINCSYEYSDSWSHTEHLSFESVALTFDGMIKNSENSLAVVFAFNAAGNGHVVVTDEKEDCSYTVASGHICTDNSADVSEHDESESKFVSGSFSLKVTAALNGISNATSISLNGSRSEYHAGNASAEVAYDGKRLNISAPVNIFPSVASDESPISVVTVTDQNGVVMTLSEDINKNLQGTISVSDTAYATMKEVNGLMKISYTNGQFESIQ